MDTEQRGILSPEEVHPTGSKRRAYTREQKEEAVRLVRLSGQSVAQVTRDLGLPEIHFHVAGRYSFTSQLIMRGVPARVVQ